MSSWKRLLAGLGVAFALNATPVIRRGLPFTSAEQLPHFPALQFQRQARSFALSA